MVVRAAFVALGGLALIVGVIGIVVPLVPTTPLLLLAAACFVRGSERLHRALLANRWVGAAIRQYQTERTVTRRTRALALVMLWSGIGFSMLRVDLWGARVALALVAALVTRHLLLLRTRE